MSRPPVAADWRDASAYDRLIGIDRTGLIWEYIRRDSAYVAWYAEASQVTRGAADPASWGLHFR